MTKITIEKMMEHWHSYSANPGSLVGTIMEGNITDFVTNAGIISKGFFINSFASGGFDGRKWPVCTSNWGRKFTNPIMLDTETLKKSIIDSNDERKQHQYEIRTTENSSPIPKKRGRQKGGINLMQPFIIRFLSIVSLR
ncbi:MAG: hypothetical protein LUF04_09815 [Bacteroides sp.]|nr:hypothetical protein [Bacteroides sp.]